MKTYSLHELCHLSGVTRKALRLYDEKGLVSPIDREEGEYRHYDENAVARLYEVLAFKAMGFKLSEVQRILDDPTYDVRKSIEDQIEEMERQKAELEMLIGYARHIVFYGILPIPKVEGSEYSLSQYLSDYVEESNLDKILESLSEAYQTDPQRYDDINKVGEELINMVGEEPDSKGVQRIVKKFRKLLAENLELYPIETFRAFATVLVSGGAYEDMMEEEFSKEAVDFAAKAIEVYCNRVEEKYKGRATRLEIKQLFREELNNG